MVNLKRLIHPLSIVILSPSLAVILVMIVGMNALAIAPADEAISAVAPGDGFILRFNPTITQFEVITLPIVAGRSRQPHSLAVISNPTNDEVWYTDPGADIIGRLTYTTTHDYTFTEFDLPRGSKPFDLVANDEHIWFTAREGNWIGRLTISTTELVSFPIPTANSAPWNIDLGSDESVWFVEKSANSLGRLVVTDTNDFVLFEYPIPANFSQPEGLAIERQNGFDQVWFGVRDITPPNYNRIVRFNLIQLPPDDFLITGPLPNPSYPVNLSVKGNDVWFTELLGNNIGLIFFSTFTHFLRYPVLTFNSQPYDLVVDTSKNVWFSERIGRNLGKLSATVSGVQIFEYPVPAYLTSVWLQGIALGPRGDIWLASFVPELLYLPTIVKEASD